MNSDKDVVVNGSSNSPAFPTGGYHSSHHNTAFDDAEAAEESSGPFKPADAWLFLETLRARWRWIVYGGIIAAGLAFVAGAFLWKPGYIASARLIRNESPRSAEVFAYQTLTPQTYVSLLRSPELLSHVASLADPPVSADRFAKRIRLTPERDGDVVHVQIFGPTKKAAMAAANLYASEAVLFTQKLQSNAAEEVRRFIEPQLSQVESEIVQLRTDRQTPPEVWPTGKSAARPSPLMVKLQKAREEVVDALTQYMESHPVVQAARAKVEALERQLDSGEAIDLAPTETEIAGTIALQRDALDMLRSELQPLETTRHELVLRQRAADLVAKEPPGYYRILSPALLRDVQGTNREVKLAAVTIFFGLAGAFGVALLALLVEVTDPRLKAAADVTRVTGLPVLATAPDLTNLPLTEQRNWGFRTWKRLQGRLSETLNHGLVCGLTSAGHGEGRSTMIRHLARAASESGFRVLTVSARHETRNGHRNGAASHPPETNGNKSTAIALQSLPTPMEVEQKFADAHPVVHIPLPGWVWNLERRKQWQSALDEWRRIDNVVIFVELPPASMPEAVLLAEETPNVIWLTDSGTAKAGETRAQLETLRDARCNLVGAILNRAPEERVKGRFARWVSSVALAALLPMSLTAQNLPVLSVLSNQPPAQLKVPTLAQTTVPNTPPPATTDDPTVPKPVVNFLGSSSVPTERAPWQERFTLGPGDVLRIGLYGAPELTKADVVVAPDGRIGFLEASGVLATGKTVDELRQALDQALGEFRRAPRTMVTPVAFNSKKYCVLGKVNQRGIYPLEHPTTVLEAIARAKGFEVGLQERDSIDLVDLSRSFLMRDGQRVPVNFERMFLDGDLSQNVALAPGDYLFFPSVGLKEVHVIGDVKYPGTVTHVANLGAVGAIAQRAGFNEKAYKSKVLVIRGSLDQPQSFVVNCNEVLTGQAPDFPLQPKDIVYVSRRPWWRAEDLLDLAITAFLQSVVTVYVGQDVLSPFKD